MVFHCNGTYIQLILVGVGVREVFKLVNFRSLNPTLLKPFVQTKHLPSQRTLPFLHVKENNFVVDLYLETDLNNCQRDSIYLFLLNQEAYFLLFSHPNS